MTFSGNKEIATTTLQEKIDIKLGSVFNPADVSRSVEKVRDHYEDEGYFEVQITTDTVRLPDGDVSVVFRVVEGRKITIDAIVIEGAKGLTPKQIKAMMATQERQYIIFRGTVQRLKLDEDLDRIVALYNDHGDIQARVESSDIKIDRERGRATHPDRRRRGRPVPRRRDRRDRSQPESAFFFKSALYRTLLWYDHYRFRRANHALRYQVYRNLLSHFDALLPVSDYCLSESRLFWLLPPSRLYVAHNGVNLNQFKPDRASAERKREELGITKKILLYVGRVGSQKGSDLLIKAAGESRRRGLNTQLVVVGPIGQLGNQIDHERWAEQDKKRRGDLYGSDRRRLSARLL